MDLRKVLVQSRKLPAQHVEGLWENIYKHNVKVETLSSILAFYQHHRVYPPPVQRAFDSLLIAFTGAKVPRKLRTLLFQTVEEMCLWLSPSCVTDTVRLSMSPSVVAGLLPCFLINKDIPTPPHTVYEWLIGSLTSPGLRLEDRARVLGFLMRTLPADLTPSLNKQLITWLSYSRTPQTTGGLFRSADVTELDGSPAMGICTALTLASTVTELQYLSLVAFSGVRRYLWRTRSRCDTDLTSAVCGYCSAVMAQAARKATQPHDRATVAAVLEEVVMVLSTVALVDASSAGKSQLMIKTVQHLADQLRMTSVLVSVWEHQIAQGGESSLTDRMLGPIVKSEFSSGAVSHRLAAALSAHSRGSLAAHVARHWPNVLKLVATHPSALVEEFLTIVTRLGLHLEYLTEVFHSLLDLPILSASICLHQSSLLVQAGFKVPALLTARQQVEVEPNLNSVFSHMMRTQIKPQETMDLLPLFPDYWAQLRPLFTLGLVEVCSQITPLLLQVFLESVHNNFEANMLLLPVLFSRVSLICPIPTFQKAVYEVLSEYLSKVVSLQPALVEDPSVIQFLSVGSYCQVCPLLFRSVVSAVGDHVKTQEIVVQCFDTLEAILREQLMEKSAKDMKLETSVCDSLAKLSSRNANLISRAINVFEKLIKRQEAYAGEDREIILQHTKELIRVLNNPRLATVVLSPTCKEDRAMATLVKVLFQFLD